MWVGDVVHVSGGCSPCGWGMLSMWVGDVVHVGGGCSPCGWGM